MQMELAIKMAEVIPYFQFIQNTIIEVKGSV